MVGAMNCYSASVMPEDKNKNLICLPILDKLQAQPSVIDHQKEGEELMLISNCST